MSMLLIDLMRRYWVQIGLGLVAVAAIGVVGVQHMKLEHYATKLEAAAKLHQEDEQRLASLGKELTHQNAAITALQTAQTKKEQAVDKALVVARVQQQKVVTLLAPTNDKRPASCEEAMPDGRNILKGLAQ
jgi:uncharacterized coiled-coil protein SlyX